VPVLDLFADAPVGNPKASAYLLAAYAGWFPPTTIFLCVVDSGVGGTRPPITLAGDNRWYIGPGNGLFELVQRRADKARSWDIEWKPNRLSPSFHGRDLFAPVAARLARGESPPGPLREDDADRRPDWPDDLYESFTSTISAMPQPQTPRGRARGSSRQDDCAWRAPRICVSRYQESRRD
jgi:hypothetical protein